MLARSSNIPTAIVLVVALVAAGFAEMQNRSVYEERERAHVLDRVALLRARLEGNINANIQLVRGLVSMVAVEPDVDQARFSEIGQHFSARTPNCAMWRRRPTWCFRWSTHSQATRARSDSIIALCPTNCALPRWRAAGG